ncbi:GNAT family N-acetyltransferase [Derxia lacustris]|uniref:GNAT family N-acetyltransferase n=1 Tax=Derxia lacustris TaxID=764842 RepID=UPI0015937425|nr:GNAT family N-acetyltransferase [Derxia lacustris]
MPPTSSIAPNILSLRNLAADDAVAAAGLLEELGYPATPADVARRLTQLEQWPDQCAFVACLDRLPVGLCQVQGVRLIASDGYAEVQALVVTQACRGRGVGRALLRHAVEWAGARGYARVRLRSGTQREAAHRFYEANGFARAKASYAFEIATRR